MTLRRKTLLIIILTLVCLIAIVYYIASAILLDNFTRLEAQIARQNVERVQNALFDSLSNLDITAEDYASWDDTYTFVDTLDPEYTRTNFYDDGMSDLDLNLALIVNASHQIIFGKGVNLQTGQVIPLSGSLPPHFDANSPLLQHTDIKTGITGILLLPEAPLLFSSRPILTSFDEGPSHGSLILGRYLDDPRIEQLAELTNLALHLERFDAPNLPIDYQSAQAALAANNAPYIQPLNDNLIAGYFLVTDIYNKPALILRMDMPRNIYAQGRTSIRYFIVSLLAVGLVFIIVIIWLLEKMVLSRLTRLSADVRQIETVGNPAARVALNGQDELADLGNDINNMLAALQRTQLELNEAKQAAEQAQQEAEIANRAKSDFLANMSHELRTPLNAIIGYSEILLEDAEDTDQTQFTPDLQRIRTSGQLLLSVINDVLDLSKIEAGRIELYLETFHIVPLVDDAHSTVFPLCEKNGNSLVIHCPDNIGTMHADATKVRQSLLNLLSNAAKFTRQGTITLTVARETTADHHQPEWVMFSVSDTGIGLSEAEIRRLFQPYTQANISTPLNYGGTGLGLTISRHFCRMMGGDITVTSAGLSGLGATFTIRLPAKVLL